MVGRGPLGSAAQLELLDKLGFGVWVYDGESISYVNQALVELTGFERAELLQAGFFEKLIHPDDHDRVVRRGRARILGKSEPEAYDLRIIANGGIERTLSVRARRTELDGRSVSVVSVTDATPLHEAERAIRAGTGRVIAFLNDLPAHIIATDADGRPTFVNDHWLDFTGQSREEAMARGTAPLIHPDDVHAAHAAWESAKRSGEAYEIEYRVRDFGGAYRWQMFRILPTVEEGGRLIGWTSVSLDIHETKTLRDELQRAVSELGATVASKDELLGLIAHELRSPLTALMTGSAYLQRHHGELSSSDLASMLSDLFSDSNRLYAVLENMLVLSRVYGGEVVAETEPVRIGVIARDTVEQFQHRTKVRPVEFVSSATLPLVSINAGYYRQVLNNLLSNAHKYSPLGTCIDVVLSVEGASVVTTVRDRGPGVPEHDIQNVFAPFFRSKDQSAVAGIGLGLTVCQRLVELHGGRISVTNLPESGCEFAFTVPIDQELQDVSETQIRAHTE